jgi:hypothetical protein
MFRCVLVWMHSFQDGRPLVWGKRPIINQVESGVLFNNDIPTIGTLFCKVQSLPPA